MSATPKIYGPADRHASAAAGGVEAVALCERLHPSVVFLDVNMSGKGGLEAIGRIRAASPDTRILVLTVEDDEDVVIEAIDAGATAYLSKERMVHSG